jgi:dTDP-4-dehydrorhamnose reductase
MIFLLGASGYVGSAFRRELARAWLPHRAISRIDLDYTKFRPLFDALRQHRPDLVILCGGYTGRPTMYHCESHRSETILGNVGLALTVAQACEAAGVRLSVVSCGCVFAGGWVQNENGEWVIRENIQTEDLALFLASRSARVRGFADDDAPNATLENGASFYGGTLAAMEKALQQFPATYIWRLNVPFAEHDHPRNFLTRVQTSPQLLQRWNSFTHLRDAVTAGLQIWNSELPGGPYNLVNPGYMSTRDLVGLIRKHRHPGWEPSFTRDHSEFHEHEPPARRWSTLLEAKRLAEAGIKMRPAEVALTDAIRNWDSG